MEPFTEAARKGASEFALLTPGRRPARSSSSPRFSPSTMKCWRCACASDPGLFHLKPDRFSGLPVENAAIVSSLQRLPAALDRRRSLGALERRAVADPAGAAQTLIDAVTSSAPNLNPVSFEDSCPVAPAEMPANQQVTAEANPALVTGSSGPLPVVERGFPIMIPSPRGGELLLSGPCQSTALRSRASKGSRSRTDRHPSASWPCLCPCLPLHSGG